MACSDRSKEELEKEIEQLRKRIADLENGGVFAIGAIDAAKKIGQVRVLDRKPLFVEVPIHVIENPSNQGTVINMTVKGLGVKGIECKIHESLRLKIWPPENLNLKSFSLEAICRWTRIEEADGTRHSGFEITNISESDKVNLLSLLMMLGYEYLRDQFRRRKGEEALKLVEASSDLICRLNEKGIITFVNNAFCKFSSLPVESLIGLNFEVFVSEKFKSDFREFLKKHLFKDYHGSYECWFISGTGDQRFFDWSIDTRLDEENADIEFQLVGRDITESNKKAQTLRDSHKELESRIKERTFQLEQVNSKLIEEIKQRKKMEEALDKKLWALTRPDVGIQDLNLTDLIDIKTLGKIQEAMSDLWSVPIELIDKDGDVIIPNRHETELYSIINSTREGRNLIKIKNIEALGKVGNEPIFFEPDFLLTGEVNFIVPITIQETVLGAWKIGKGFEKKIGYDEVKKLACSIKVNPERFWESLENSPPVSKDQHYEAASFLSFLSSQVSALAVQNLFQARMISELKQAQSQLEASEQKLRRLFESAPVGIFVTESGIISFANNTLIEMFGFSSKSEMEERPLNGLFKFINPERGMFKSKHLEELTSDESVSLQAIKKNGSAFDVSLYCNKMNEDLASTLIGFVIDKSQENALRSQLLHSQKMEALGTLAGGIAHDFNNVLTVIMGYAEIALADMAQNDVVASRLNQILEASKRARDLVSQILTFSRKGEQQKQALNVIPIIKETIKFLEASFPSTIKITHNVKSNDRMIMGDPSQIHQVLMNLCSNAGYAMRQQGGILDISLELISEEVMPTLDIHGLKPGDYLRLVVKDTGPGIDPNIRERIFEPYFTTKPQGEGTGLGLAVVHGIVSNHGGAIRVDPDYNRGARFEVFLPVIKSLKRQDEEEKELEVLGNERIMVVDDEEIVARMVKDILILLGYKVSAFSNPVSALNIFRIHAYDFDLVMTDLTMNAMTGPVLAKEIRKIRPDIPVILLTGYDISDENTQKELEMVDGIIQKPFTKGNLGKAIREALEPKS